MMHIIQRSTRISTTAIIPNILHGIHEEEENRPLWISVLADAVVDYISSP
jgi:hypothetical protein